MSAAVSQPSKRPLPPVETRWPAGVSANPGGRPKVVTEIRELCRVKAPGWLERLDQIALKGSHTNALKAIQIGLAYGFGRPVARIEVRQVRGIADLSDEELKALIAEARGEVVDAVAVDETLAIETVTQAIVSEMVEEIGREDGEGETC